MALISNIFVGSSRRRRSGLLKSNEEQNINTKPEER
jgi:hypothetical protein